MARLGFCQPEIGYISPRVSSNRDFPGHGSEKVIKANPMNQAKLILLNGDSTRNDKCLMVFNVWDLVK